MVPVKLKKIRAFLFLCFTILVVLANSSSFMMTRDGAIRPHVRTVQLVQEPLKSFFRTVPGNSNIIIVKSTSLNFL